MCQTTSLMGTAPPSPATLHHPAGAVHGSVAGAVELGLSNLWPQAGKEPGSQVPAELGICASRDVLLWPIRDRRCPGSSWSADKLPLAAAILSWTGRLGWLEAAGCGVSLACPCLLHAVLTRLAADGTPTCCWRHLLSCQVAPGPGCSVGGQAGSPLACPFGCLLKPRAVLQDCPAATKLQMTSLFQVLPLVKARRPCTPPRKCARTHRTQITLLEASKHQHNWYRACGAGPNPCMPLLLASTRA